MVTTYRLFVTRELFKDVIEKISMYYEVEVWDKYTPPPYETLIEKVKDVDAMVSLLTDRIDCNLISKAKRLKIIAQYAVGFDNIDLECATRNGIYVTNTPGVLTESTAELTWTLILAVSRRIVEADNFVRWGGMVENWNCMAPKNDAWNGINGEDIGNNRVR